MKQWFKDAWYIIKHAGINWADHDAFQLSAVVAYYAIFSIPALLVIIITLSGVFFNEEAITGQIYTQLNNVIGNEAARTVQNAIVRSGNYGDKWYAIALSIGTLLFGATGVFFQLQKILNRIWGVEPRPKRAFVKMLKDRATSLGVILAIGFLLLVSLVLTSLLNGLSNWLEQFVPELLMNAFYVSDFVLSFSIITLLFALIYKVLPDVVIGWRSVWIGAGVTTALFLVGKFALGFYFGQADPASTYGAAGSLVLILLWVNYSALIFIYGAEFTQIYACQFGHQFKPSSHAVFIKKIERKQELRDDQGVEAGEEHKPERQTG